MKQRWGWLDPLCFVLPSGQGNTEMTCYSCAAARDLSMSPYFGLWFFFTPTYTYHSRVSDWLETCASYQNICSKIHRRTLSLSEECSGLGRISWYHGMIWSDSVCECVCVCALVQLSLWGPVWAYNLQSEDILGKVLTLWPTFNGLFGG